MIVEFYTKKFIVMLLGTLIFSGAIKKIIPSPDEAVE
jgi:hypothetical protein